MPRTDRRNLRLSATAGIMLIGALAVILVALPARPAAQTAGPPQSALDGLQEMSEVILEAKADNAGDAKDVKKLAKRAQELKLTAIEGGFRGQTIHGCPAHEWVLLLELIDGDLSRAVAGSLKRVEGRLLKSFAFAKEFADLAAECAEQRERVISEQVEKQVKDLGSRASKGKLSREALREGAERVEKLKRELVAGERVYGCEVVRTFTLIQSIDRALASAEVNEDRKLRASLLRRAAVQSGELIERWRELPCEPPPPEQFTVTNRLSWWHVNGFGNPPSRECNTVLTDPQQGGATVTDVITTPSGGEVTKTVEADQGGEARISMNITETGTYTHQTTVLSAAGVQATDTDSQTVTAQSTGAHGECPPPTP
jgi:hypothetical protein